MRNEDLPQMPWPTADLESYEPGQDQSAPRQRNTGNHRESGVSRPLDCMAVDRKYAVSHEIVVHMMEDGINAYGAHAVCHLDNSQTLQIDYKVKGDSLMTVRELHNVMSMGDVLLDDGRKGYSTLEYIECAS